jgi:aldehyde dehydrogenase (NAD+)
MGSPFDDETFLGPQISSDQHSKILGMIEKALQEGAICATGRKGDFGGWFIKPTVLRDVHQNMTIMKEEVFGPVVAVAPFKNKEDVLELANDTCYGLAAGIFTNRIHEALLLTREIQAGTVWINCYNAISHQLPFGGYKQSGNGKDLGEAALGEFTQTKTVRFMS